MMSRIQCLFVLTALVIAGNVCLAQAPARPKSDSPPASKGQQVLEQAGKDGKFTFILFYKTDDAATQAMGQVLKSELAERSDKAVMVYVQISNPAEKAIVDQFGVARAPMPMTMTLAPNGALTGVYPQKISPKNLNDAIVTPAMTRCMKSLQEGKVVLVCVQSSTKAFAPPVVKEFQADPHFKDRLATVSLKADDPAEARFMGDMKLDPASVTSTTVAMLAPPGMLIGKFGPKATKDEMAAALAKAGKCCDDPNCKHHEHQAPSTGAASRSAKSAPSTRRN